MKNLVIILLVSLVGCSPYQELLKPLKHIPANCYCRYAQAAKHLYNCELSENLRQHIPFEDAQLLALQTTHKWIREVQIREAREPKLRCDCNDASPRRYN